MASCHFLSLSLLWAVPAASVDEAYINSLDTNVKDFNNLRNEFEKLHLERKIARVGWK